MMIDRNNLYGTEFDWFAIDENNNISLLSSAGYGDIPNIVMQHFKEYEKISELLLTPHYGSMKIWEDFAGYGLFVFDWKIYNGPYEKKKEPIKEITEELRKMIMEISDIPKWSVDFHKTTIIKMGNNHET